MSSLVVDTLLTCMALSLTTLSGLIVEAISRLSFMEVINKNLVIDSYLIVLC
jgi:hypothetical protein